MKVSFAKNCLSNRGDQAGKNVKKQWVAPF
jgi:hypothetical protein